jgi:uncharacterized membrane protein (Fun14 family)
MDWLVSIFTSSGLGAITGLVGGYLAKKEARKMAEVKYTHDEKMAEYNRLELEAEQAHAVAMVDKKIDLAEAEGAIEVDKAEVGAFTESIKQQGKSTGSVLFDGIKSTIRPIITFWLLYELSVLSGRLEELTGGLEALSATEQLRLYMVIVDAIIFLTTTAVGWWFASRKGQV